jgi:hypothetical protein
MKSPFVSLTLDEQIAHIEEHREAFQEHQGHLAPYGDRGDVRGYFLDHLKDAEDQDGYGALYIYLCNDLGLVPRGVTN